ncbi:hypothetical protein E2C01_026736 [Portunus trituberculatus]|uniref:Uncharacterized protein n=1 Tax=Portunus trituberculatus TaxID=210409 RepID=A0A5B7EJF8_PORTR|nr:hypothetical protein [Portunus trituberculatus]
MPLPAPLSPTLSHPVLPFGVLQRNPSLSFLSFLAHIDVGYSRSVIPPSLECDDWYSTILPLGKPRTTAQYTVGTIRAYLRGRVVFRGEGGRWGSFLSVPLTTERNTIARRTSANTLHISSEHEGKSHSVQGRTGVIEWPISAYEKLKHGGLGWYLEAGRWSVTSSSTTTTTTTTTSTTTTTTSTISTSSAVVSGRFCVTSVRGLAPPLCRDDSVLTSIGLEFRYESQGCPPDGSFVLAVHCGYFVRLKS